MTRIRHIGELKVKLEELCSLGTGLAPLYICVVVVRNVACVRQLYQVVQEKPRLARHR